MPAMTHDDVTAMVNHPFNQVRLLMRKHGFEGPLPIVPVKTLVDQPFSIWEIRAVIKGETQEDVEIRRDLLAEEFQNNSPEYTDLRQIEIYLHRYIAVQFTVDDGVDTSEAQQSAEVPTIVVAPGARRVSSVSHLSQAANAARAAQGGSGEAPGAEVAALLEAKKTASAEEARKIRQKLRKLGYYISHQ